MSDIENATVPEVSNEASVAEPAIAIEIEEKPKKKQKKPMTPERKAQLMANLAKGKEKALETRRRNALERKRLKEEQKKFEKNNTPAPAPAPAPAPTHDYKSELEELKNLIKEMRSDKGSNHKDEINAIREEMKQLRQDAKTAKTEEKKVEVPKPQKRDENPIIDIPIKKKAKAEAAPAPPPVRKPKIVSTIPTNIWAAYKN